MDAERSANPVPPQTRMGAVQLIVSDLQRSIDFWTTTVGLRVHERDDDLARLGTGGEDLIVLEEIRGAPQVGRHTGLFHVALLLPQATDLATWLVHASRDHVPMTGASDHFVSEALYLNDPDGHGIEIYRDRPRDAWRWNGDAVEMGSIPLDVDRLLETLGDIDVMATPFDGMPAGTTVGHVHLRVADIPATVAFYRDLIGFDLIVALGEEAAFLAAGRYHHHIGGNTWASRGAAPAPAGSATLRHATIVFPDNASRDAAATRVAAGGQQPHGREDGLLVHDPSQNPLLLAVA